MATLTHAQLLTRIANRLRIPTSDTTTTAKIEAVMNDAYRQIAALYDFWWLYDRQVIVTSAPITTGTISVTNASTSATYSDAPTPSTAGRVLHIPSNTTELYLSRISAHTAAATALTLESAYTGDDDTDATFTVWQDRYDLATDCGKVLWIRRTGYTQPLQIISPEEMIRLKGWDTSEGPPHVATVLGFDTEGDPTTQKQLHVHPYPDDTYTLEVWYRQALNTEVSSSTRYLIPDDFIHVLEFATMADSYLYFLNDAERGAFYERKYQDALKVMVARHREHEGNPQITAADHYRSFYSRRRRVTPATADLGSYFDRYPTIP